MPGRENRHDRPEPHGAARIEESRAGTSGLTTCGARPNDGMVAEYTAVLIHLRFACAYSVSCTSERSRRVVPPTGALLVRRLAWRSCMCAKPWLCALSLGVFIGLATPGSLRADQTATGAAPAARGVLSPNARAHGYTLAELATAWLAWGFGTPPQRTLLSACAVSQVHSTPRSGLCRRHWVARRRRPATCRRAASWYCWCWRWSARKPKETVAPSRN